MKKKQCVYIFEMEDGTVKIGITGDIEARRYNVSTKKRMKIKRVYHTNFIDHKNAISIERRLHEKFVHERLEGEFFKINFSDACSELDGFFDEIEESLLNEEEITTDLEKVSELERKVKKLESDLEMARIENRITILENKMARLKKIINF